jgi:predicted peptidase
MRVLHAVAGLAISTSITTATLDAQDVIDGYVARMFTGSGAIAMPYRLFTPANAASGPLPLIVYLHGGGGAGTDNLQQLSGGNTTGTRAFISPEWQGRQAAYVAAPQLPDPHFWYALESDALAPYGTMVIELVESLLREHNIDADRVYLTGQSRGGRGTWDIARKRPDLFAAAVPLCGEGTPSKAASLRDMPIWAFHGSDDPTVPVTGSRDMVAALRTLGSSVRYTEYPGVAHNVWTLAYVEPELPEWLFQQKRRRS